MESETPDPQPDATPDEGPRPATPAVTPGAAQTRRVDGSPESAENTDPTEEAAPGIPSAGRVIADDEPANPAPVENPPA